MNPYYYKLRGLDIYIMVNTWLKTANFTNDKSKAAILRTKNSNIINNEIEYDGTIRGSIPNDQSTIETLRAAGYNVEKHTCWTADIPFDDFEKIEIEEIEVSQPTFTGEYVIKIKNSNIYIATSNTLTINRGEAKIYSNPKTDIIGKLERGMNMEGMATEDNKQVVEMDVSYKGPRGPKVIEYLKTTDEGKKLATQLKSGIYDLNESINNPIGRFFSVKIPVKYLEREKL